MFSLPFAGDAVSDIWALSVYGTVITALKMGK